MANTPSDKQLPAPTPRTDNLYRKLYGEKSSGGGAVWDHARQLERELAEAESRATAWEAKFQSECAKHDATTLRAMTAERATDRAASFPPSGENVPETWWKTRQRKAASAQCAVSAERPTIDASATARELWKAYQRHPSDDPQIAFLAVLVDWLAANKS